MLHINLSALFEGIARPVKFAHKEYQKRSPTVLWNIFRSASSTKTLYKKPEAWRKTQFEYFGQSDKPRTGSIYRYESPAPRGIIAYITGWKSDPLEHQEAVNELQSQGFSIVAVALENPGRQAGSLPDSIGRIKSFLFDARSPVHQDYDSDLPRFIVTHSTSGMLYQLALLEAEDEFDSIPSISHAYHTAAFFDTANSSRIGHRFIHNIFRLYQEMFLKKVTGETIIDKLYFYATGLGHKLIDEPISSRPTHEQVQEISDYGTVNYVRWRESQKQRHPTRIPQTFVISRNDSYACPITQEYVAELEGAEIMWCRDEHNPLENPITREKIINRIKDITSGTQPSMAINRSPDPGMETSLA